MKGMSESREGSKEWSEGGSREESRVREGGKE